LYVGYDQDTSNFCTQNIITLKTSTGHSESDPIADPSAMLGPRGHIVSWFRIIGIAQVVATVFNVGFFFRLAIGRVLAILMICDHIFQFVYMVLGFRLYLSGIPQECIDFKMGNNTAYTLLVYISISNIVLYSAVVFFICTAVLIGCCRMCHLGHTERISLLYHLVDSWRNSPESTGTQETSSKLSSTNPKTLGLFDKVKSPDTTQKGNAT
jgi:hypothetical protein